MKILHISDTHGDIPTNLPPCDLIIHTGDLLPNKHGSPLDLGFQKDWVVRKRAALQNFANHPRIGVVFVPGNHDWFDPEPVIDRWVTVVDRVEMVEGVAIYGLPYVPHYGGRWNYERLPGDLAALTSDVFAAPLVDILAAHCPPWGMGDLVPRGEHIGNAPLANLLVHAEHEIKLVLCGHCHEGSGFVGELGGAVVVNSAQRFSLLDFSDILSYIRG